MEFDRAARSRSPVLFFFGCPWFSEQWRYRDCARICVLLKHKRCGFKEIFQFHFCEKSNKRIHFNYEEIWFFFKSDILVEFWFGLFVFKLVKVHLQWKLHQRSRQDPITPACQDRISSTQLLIFLSKLGADHPSLVFCLDLTEFHLQVSI